MEAIRSAIFQVLAESNPMSVRQVYYQLTTLGVIHKTEKEYKNTVVRLLVEMRRDGTIPYLWLADATRWMRKPDTWDSPAEAVDALAGVYRRHLWRDRDAVEVWIEKEALAGVLVDVTDRWDVPLMVTRGYPSLSYLYSAAVQIADRWLGGRRTTIYYLGDHDPSGRDIDRAVVDGVGQALRSILIGLGTEAVDRYVESVRQYEIDSGFDAPDDGYLEWIRRQFPMLLEATDDKEWEAETNRTTFGRCGATFERLAVLPEQIRDWNLPSRPTKRTDTRSKNFTGESVELDAIPPDTLRGIVEEAILQHVDRSRLAVLERVEGEERRGLERIAALMRSAA